MLSQITNTSIHQGEDEFVYGVDIIGDAVAATQAALLADPSSWLSVNNKTITYIYGDRDEINTQLQSASNAKISKAIFIALVMPFAESDGEKLEATLSRIIIATITPKELLFPQRYQQFFKPLLYPIYREFKKQINQCIEVNAGTIPITKMDVPRIVPTATDGLTNDIVDAIVVSIPKSKFFKPLIS